MVRVEKGLRDRTKEKKTILQDMQHTNACNIDFTYINKHTCKKDLYIVTEKFPLLMQIVFIEHLMLLFMLSTI